MFMSEIYIIDCMSVKNPLYTCFEPEHLQRTLSISLVVGTWLTVFNQGDVLVVGHLDLWLFLKIFLNYITPFVVANAGLLSRQAGTVDTE